jgi:hypothetical protein
MIRRDVKVAVTLLYVCDYNERGARACVRLMRCSPRWSLLP